jgi:hypothetical protein
MCLLTRCVLPPLVAEEDAGNRAPVIDVNASRPSTSLVELNLNCDSCTFSVQVDDEDRDTLYFRWFWDFDTDPTTARCNDSVVAPVNGARRDPIVCAYDVIRHSDSTDGSYHTMEVWVSDREFTGGLGDRSIRDGANVVVRQWTVSLRKRGVDCPTVENITCSVRTAQ